MRSALAKSVCHEIHFTPHHMNFNVSDPILVPSVHQYSCFAWQRTPELVDGTYTQKSPKIGLSQTVILHIFVRFRVSVVLYSTSYRDECQLLTITTDSCRFACQFFFLTQLQICVLVTTKIKPSRTDLSVSSDIKSVETRTDLHVSSISIQQNWPFQPLNLRAPPSTGHYLWPHKINFLPLVSWSQVRDGLCKLCTQHATTVFKQSAPSCFIILSSLMMLSVYIVQLGLGHYFFFTLGLPGHFSSFLGPQTGN